MNSRKRHIAKTLTWRIVASITTFILTMIFFKGDPDATQKVTWVVLTESSLKLIFYYYHERIWFLNKSRLKSNVRHLLKTVTWRMVASGTTFIVTYLIFHSDDRVVGKATIVAFMETFIKMLLYYLHERAWYTQAPRIEETKPSGESKTQ